MLLQKLVSSTFPSILPTLFRSLLLIWGFVLLADKNETHAGGHEAGISWLGRGGQIRREKLSGNVAGYLSSLEKAPGHILVSKSERHVCTQPRSLPVQKAIPSLILA